MLARARVVMLIFLGTAGIAALVYLMVNVARDLRLLNSARSDNVQWTLSQAEVEFLDYHMHLAIEPMQNAPDLALLRRKYDIFYSRITTLQQSSIYATLRGVPDFSRHLRIVRTYLDRTVGFIDADDAGLIQALPKLREMTADLRANVRSLGNSGLNYFANASDERRQTVALTLLQLAVGVSALVLALLAFAIYFNRLSRQNIRRRRETIETSERMNIVTSTALDAVIVSDANGVILEFNAAAEQIFGHPAAHAIGREMGDLIVPDKYLAAHNAGMKRMRENGEKRVVGKGRVQLEAKRANGQDFPVELAIQQAETDKGAIFISFLRDISHRVKAEQELVAARDRALAGEKAKTDFLATMSHEIRTPLNGLLGNLTLLQDTRLNSKQSRFIKNMNTSGKLLMSHISDVLDITKYDAGKLQLRPVAMNISTLLQDIVDNQSGAALAHDTTIEWGWVGPATDWIRADRNRLQHVLMNVIGNAVKFTRHGKISILAEVTAPSDLRISVSDTGIGMNADLQTQIFDDFMTGDSSYDRDVGGTGLGLGIAQRFVTALGGTIEVDSTEGKGSTFCIQFPITPIAPPDETKRAPQHAKTARPSNILMVEDNEINRDVARAMLTAAGHRVTEAHNGREALEKIKEAPFDLILMDISMPVMDGSEATRAIRASHADWSRTPIIGLTANAMAEEQEAFLRDGMNDILTKPLSRDELIRVISEHVSERPGSPEAPPETTAPVALTYLDELRDTFGAEKLQGLLDRFTAEVEDLLTYLRDQGSKDLPETAARTHKVSGGAATFGAVALRAVLVDLENSAETGDSPATQDQINALPEVWRATRDLIRGERRAEPR